MPRAPTQTHTPRQLTNDVTSQRENSASHVGNSHRTLLRQAALRLLLHGACKLHETPWHDNAQECRRESPLHQATNGAAPAAATGQACEDTGTAVAGTAVATVPIEGRTAVRRGRRAGAAQGGNVGAGALPMVGGACARE